MVKDKKYTVEEKNERRGAFLRIYMFETMRLQAQSIDLSIVGSIPTYACNLSLVTIILPLHLRLFIYSSSILPSFLTIFLMCFTVSVYFVFLGQTRNVYCLMDQNWPTEREGWSYGGMIGYKDEGRRKVCVCVWTKRNNVSFF